MPLDHKRHVIHALPCSFFGGIGEMQGNDGLFLGGVGSQAVVVERFEEMW